jgi:hypothetical protein
LVTGPVEIRAMASALEAGNAGSKVTFLVARTPCGSVEILASAVTLLPRRR